MMSVKRDGQKLDRKISFEQMDDQHIEGMTLIMSWKLDKILIESKTSDSRFLKAALDST